MHLASLKLANFKTYADVDVDFCSNVNCLVGDNGVGKTNLLEAIYYLSFCKSFSSLPDTQNIRLDEPFFAIHGDYDIDGESVKVSCIQKRGQAKQMLWGKKAYKTLGEHIGRIPLVMVSPMDQGIITGGSDGRRKFIDGILSQVDHGYFDHLLQYQKALEQRNRLLKQFYEDRAWDEASISIWDDQLVRHGEVLYQGRKDFLVEFKPLFDEYFSWITGSSEEGRMEYICQPAPLAQQLAEARQADKYAQYTTVGPHKDDLELAIGYPVSGQTYLSVKRFGSQGQQKTFVLAMKLAQFEYIYRQCGRKPILLLDDVFDKLDLGRVTQLVHLVGSDRFGQVFLTDTQPGRVQHIFEQIPQVEHKIFTVTHGELRIEN